MTIEDIRYGKQIDYKDYCSASVKKNIIDNVVLLIGTSNNWAKIDRIQLEIMKVLGIIQGYTNIEISEDLKQQVIEYEYIMSSGIYKKIRENALEDIVDLEDLLWETIKDRISEFNSIEAVVKRALDKVIEKVPDVKEMNKLITKFPTVLNKIKPENLNIIKEVFSEPKFQEDVIKSQNSKTRAKKAVG